MITSSSLKAEPSVTLSRRPVDVRHTLRLTGSMANYDWGINGIRYDPAHLAVRRMRSRPQAPAGIGPLPP